MVFRYGRNERVSLRSFSSVNPSSPSSILKPKGCPRICYYHYFTFLCCHLQELALLVQTSRRTFLSVAATSKLLQSIETPYLLQGSAFPFLSTCRTARPAARPGKAQRSLWDCFVPHGASGTRGHCDRTGNASQGSRRTTFYTPLRHRHIRPKRGTATEPSLRALVIPMYSHACQPCQFAMSRPFRQGLLKPDGPCQKAPRHG